MRCIALVRFVKLIVGLSLLNLSLQGCSEKIEPLAPEIEVKLMDQLRDGGAVLTCRSQCGQAWIHNRAELKTRYAKQDWRGLAIEVMQIGFQEDLAYFYLGRAAEGLGSYEASLKYYRMASYLATGSDPTLTCRGTSDLCNGFRLPEDIYPRMRLVETALTYDRPVEGRSPHAKPKIASRSGGAGVSRSPVSPAPAPAPGTDEPWVDPPPVTR